MFFQDLPDQDSADIVEINMYVSAVLPRLLSTEIDLIGYSVTQL